MVAHIISYDNLGARALIGVAARARFRPGRVNDTALTRYDQHTPEQLLALLAGNLQPRGQPAALGGKPAWSRRSSTTRTSGGPSDSPGPSRPGGCGPRCTPP